MKQAINLGLVFIREKGVILRRVSHAWVAFNATREKLTGTEINPPLLHGDVPKSVGSLNGVGGLWGVEGEEVSQRGDGYR